MLIFTNSISVLLIVTWKHSSRTVITEHSIPDKTGRLPNRNFITFRNGCECSLQKSELVVCSNAPCRRRICVLQIHYAVGDHTSYEVCMGKNIGISLSKLTLQFRSTSTIKPPCWETSGDVFPKPCGNMTDSEKEIQLRGGTRSEGARTPRLRRTSKQCGEKNVDLLYLRAASQPKLQEKSYAQLKSTTKMCKSSEHAAKPNDDYVLLQHKKPPMYPQSNVKPTGNARFNGTRSLRQTLLAVTENFVSSAISVKKGDVVTLLACKQIQDKRLQQPIQWFFVRSRHGQEGFIPAEVAGHGFL